MDYVKRLALKDLNERRCALMEILREQEIPFIHYREKHCDNWVENIIVSINPSDKRLVIGAHYDNVIGSTGANDNATGVSTLIKLAHNLINAKTLSVDIVFFDREEYQGRGSEKYIETVGKQNISAMLNLDMCGFGDCIAVYSNARENEILKNILAKTASGKHKAKIIGYLDNSDHISFLKEDIENVYITMLPSKEIDIVNETCMKYLSGGLMPSESDILEIKKSIFPLLESIKTCHNNTMDSIEYVSEESMNQMYSFLCDVFNVLHDM